MRVTTTMFSELQSRYLARSQIELLQVQQQILTGRRINSPGDDPAATVGAMAMSDRLGRLRQVQENSGFAVSALSSLESSLGAVQDQLVRVRELVIQGSNGTNSDEDRQAIAKEIEQALENIFNLVNEDGISGNYFGGSNSSTSPFSREVTENGNVYRYQGSGDEVELDLSDGVRLGLTLDGWSIFGGGDREPTQYAGNTGARRGAGTDSATGRDLLSLIQTRTTLGDGLGAGGGDSVSGLGRGASSAGGDTVLGAAHGITLDDTSGNGSSGTVSLNGGPPINWTSADTNLAVEGPDGELVYLDLSAVSPGFSGAVGVEGEGSATLDGGKTLTPIDFSAESQLLRDSQTGSSVFVDMRSVSVSGDEELRFPGTFDLFAALEDVQQQLEAGIPEGEDGSNFNLMGEIEKFVDRVAIARSDVGSRINLAESTNYRMGELEVYYEGRRSQLEDTDITAASFRLTSLEIQIQATIAITGRLNSMPRLIDVL